MRNEEDVRDLVEGSSDGVVVVDDDLRLRFASPAARSLLGLPGGTGDTDRRLPDLVVPEDRDRVAEQLADGAVGTVHLRIPGTGGTRELEGTHHERRGEGRRVLHLRDVTVQLRRERELERMAYTDHLTRLPNRAALFQELAAATAGRCLLVVDLDGFKAVNDVAGHEAGDQLLVEVARRLRNVVRDQDVVCRLGGDEFALVVDGSPDDAREAAERVVDTMALPHRTGGFTFAIGASVGIAEVRAGGGQLAFREADTALRAAKQAGKGCVRVWADGTGPAPTDESVAAALAAGQVELRYNVAGRVGQPQRALHGEPFWRHPSGDLLPAAELWAAAGRQGQDGALQTWVLAESTRTAADLPGVPLLAVDLPAGHVRAEHLVDDVRSALAASGFPARPAVAGGHRGGDPHRRGRAGAGPARAARPGRADLPGRLRHGPDPVRPPGPAPARPASGSTSRPSAAAATPRTPSRWSSRSWRSARSFGLLVVAHGVSPGPLLDAVLARGVHLVRTREDLRHVTADRVRQELTGGTEIRADTGPVTLTFLGHSSVRVELAGRTVLTDPLLTGRVGPLRRVAPPLPPASWAGVDLVLLSHLHGDHLHLPSLRLLGRGTTVVVPRGGGAWLRARGFTAVVELAPGEVHTDGGLTVTGTPAAHSGHRWGPRSTHGPDAAAMGHLLAGDGVTVYAGRGHRRLPGDGRPGTGRRRPAPGVGVGHLAGPRPHGPRGRCAGLLVAAPAVRRAGALGHPRAARRGPDPADAVAAGRPATPLRRRRRRGRPGHHRAGHRTRLPRRAARLLGRGVSVLAAGLDRQQLAGLPGAVRRGAARARSCRSCPPVRCCRSPPRSP